MALIFEETYLTARYSGYVVEHEAGWFEAYVTIDIRLPNREMATSYLEDYLAKISSVYRHPTAASAAAALNDWRAKAFGDALNDVVAA